MAEKNEYIPADKEIEFCQWLESQVTDHPVVKVHHGKWKELIDWENGNQFSEWDSGSQTVRPIELVIRKRRVVVNLMKPLAEAIEGKINFAYQVIGSPNSADIEDVEASKIATKLIAHNDVVNHVDALFEELKYDLIRTGNAFIKWYWDKEYPAIFKGEKGEVSKGSGELIGDVPSVFNIRPDPTARRMEDCRWLIELHEVTKDWVEETFKLDEEDWKLMEPPGGNQKYRGMNEKEEEKDTSEVTYILKEYWEKKSKKYPSGRYILAIGQKSLFKGKNPALGVIPYWHFGYKKYGNSIWHTGPLHHVQGIQRDFNRQVSITSEHIEGWKAKLGVGPGAFTKEGAYTTDAFEIVEVDDSRGKPFVIPTPELSPQVTAYRDFLSASIDKVSNVHEVSYSQLPQYATRAPASLYSMMLEQENLKIDPMIKRFNRTVLVMSKFRLQMMDEYYKQDRMVKVIGKGNTATIEYFEGADLRNNYDVKLIMGISLHQSRAVQQRLLLELRGQGIITDNNKILKMLNLGEVEEELRADIADEQRAIRENQAYINETYDKPFEQGGVKIYLHDDHELHMEYHTNLIKTEEAQRWDKKVYQAFDNHIMQHFTLIMYLRQQQQTQAGPVVETQPGAGGEPPPPEGATQSPESAIEEEQSTVV